MAASLQTSRQGRAGGAISSSQRIGIHYTDSQLNLVEYSLEGCEDDHITIHIASIGDSDRLAWVLGSSSMMWVLGEGRSDIVP